MKGLQYTTTLFVLVAWLFGSVLMASFLGISIHGWVGLVYSVTCISLLWAVLLSLDRKWTAADLRERQERQASSTEKAEPAERKTSGHLRVTPTTFVLTIFGALLWVLFFFKVLSFLPPDSVYVWVAYAGWIAVILVSVSLVEARFRK